MPRPRGEEINLPGGRRAAEGVKGLRIGVVKLTALIPYKNYRMDGYGVVSVVLIRPSYGVYIEYIVRERDLE